MVKFNTIFDASITAEANKHQLKKLWWLFVLVFGIFTYIGVKDILEGYVAVGVVMIIFGVLFLPLVVWLTKVLQKRLNKSMSVMSSETKEEYQFYEDHFVIIQNKGDEVKSTTEAKYTYFYEVVETQTHYLMYISKAQMHVIDKTKITEGTLEELNEILRKQLSYGKFKEYKA